MRRYHPIEYERLARVRARKQTERLLALLRIHDPLFETTLGMLEHMLDILPDTAERLVRSGLDGDPSPVTSQEQSPTSDPLGPSPNKFVNSYEASPGVIKPSTYTFDTGATLTTDLLNKRGGQIAPALHEPGRPDQGAV